MTTSQNFETHRGTLRHTETSPLAAPAWKHSMLSFPWPRNPLNPGNPHPQSANPKLSPALNGYTPYSHIESLFCRSLKVLCRFPLDVLAHAGNANEPVSVSLTSGFQVLEFTLGNRAQDLALSFRVRAFWRLGMRMVLAWNNRFHATDHWLYVYTTCKK